MSRRILVTGGTGFIGSALVRRLVKAGDRVRVLDDNSRGASRRLSDLVDDVELVVGDVRDPEVVLSATKGCEAVAHLAYVNGTASFYSRPETVLEIGVKGTLNVLDAAVHHEVGEVWYMSSSEVYQTPQAIPTDETTSLSVPDVLNPRYSYGGGKIIGELLVINYGRKFFERVVIVRPHNVYGPDMGNEHVIPQLTDRLVALSAAQPDGVLRLPIQGTGRETRSFVFIEDFAEGAHMAFTSGDSPGVYHVGTMDERTIAEVAHLVADCLDRRVEIVEGPRPPGGTFRRCPDTTKVSALGFTPRVPLEEGLARTVRWYSDRL